MEIHSRHPVVSVCDRLSFHAADGRTDQRDTDGSDETRERGGEQDPCRSARSSYCRGPATVRPLPAVTRAQPGQVGRDLRADDGGATGRRQRRSYVQHQRRRQVFSQQDLH